MSEDNKVVFDFALISASDLRKLIQTPPTDWDNLSPLLAQVLVAWPLESDPTNVESYKDVPVTTGFQIIAAMNRTVTTLIEKPKILKRVLLEKWTMYDFSEWSRAFRTGEWEELDDLLKKVSKEYDPEKASGEDFLTIVGSVAAHIRQASTQGE